MIYLTGDTHIPNNIAKLNKKNFPEQKNLARDDYVIVLGDFGLVWEENTEYDKWKKWLENRNFTILFIDGNHENFTWLNSFPVSKWNSGKVHFISKNIIHLMRGQIFIIDKQSFFTFGGAYTGDKKERIPGVSWWAEEECTHGEKSEALKNLSMHNYKVDYILTHTCPDTLLNPLFHFKRHLHSTTGQFLNRIAHAVNFKKWYFGHMHQDKNFGKFTVLYNEIIKLK